MTKFYKITSKSFDELQVKSHKELWEKVKENHSGISCIAKTEFKSAEENKFHVIFSTDTEDRHLERVFQNFELKSFKDNPVFLDSHNYGSIEHIIGKVESIKVKEQALQGDVMFALENPKGLLAYHLAKGGFLNATSIGFIPKEFDENGNISKSELLEISAVSVPANPEALFEKIAKEIGEEAKSQTVEQKKEQKVEVKVEKKEYVEPVAYRAVKKLHKNHRKILIAIAKEMTEITPKNEGEKKRKIFSTLREAFSTN